MEKARLPPLSDPIEEAKRIIEAAESRNVVLKLFGGISFFFQCPSAKHRILQRSYVDIDFMGHSTQSGKIKQLFEESGYQGRERFNAMMGDRRLIFNDMANQRRVDIFLDVFEMCHRFNFKDRLEIERYTISLADMLATKLQIVELNEKDIKDILSVLTDHEVGDTDSGTINGSYLAKICGDNWGTYKTFTLNLDALLSTLAQWNLDKDQSKLVTMRVERLRQAIEKEPKSMKWRMRARVGERAIWYDLPAADKEVVDAGISFPE